VPETTPTIDLGAIASGIVRALLEASHLGDLESAQLAKEYAQADTLAQLPAPHFAVAEVDVTLRLAIQGVGPADRRGDAGPVEVVLAPEGLATLQPHQVSEIRLTIRSSPLRVGSPAEG
jgi:hypothetical protein